VLDQMDPSILQVVTDTDRRGAQVFATDLHRAIAISGRSVRTVALAPGTVGGLDLPVLGSKRLGGATLGALRAQVRQSAVVVAHGSSTLPACALTTLGTRTPFVYRQISDSRFWAPTRLRRLRVGRGMARAARVVALWRGSADTVNELFGVPESKLRVVPNGVPTEPFRVADAPMRANMRGQFGLRPDRPTVLSLGALAREKGVDLAVRAMGRLPDAQLLVVGEGPERLALERLAQEVAPERVVFTGSVAVPADAYAAADLLVLPSRGGDSMPAVLIEAGLCGLPAVSTPVEGIPEIVRDGDTGALVPIGDVDALTGAIARFLAEPPRARRVGAQARAHCIEHFSIEAVAEQWLSVLAEVVPALG
jgi:glycosyltransferase involved in cell wall biosynthesis